MFTKATQDFFDVLLVFGGILGVDEDVVEVDDDVDVEKVTEDILHESLESRRGVAEAERHDQHLEEPISGPEGSLPFVAFGNAYQVIGRTKVDLSVNLSLPRGIEEVRDTGKRVFVLPGDLIQTTEVVTKSQGAFLLLNEEDRSSGGRRGGTDETTPKVFRDVFFQGFMLGFRQGVDGTERRNLSILEFDLVVVASVRRKYAGLGFTEHISEVVVFGGEFGQVGGFIIIRERSASRHRR
jgi:hypothetical protein